MLLCSHKFMTRGPSDQANSAHGIDKIVESLEEAENSAVSVGGTHESTNLNSNNISNEYEEINNTLTQIENSNGENRLDQYANSDYNPGELEFGGFNSNTGRVLEKYLTQIADKLDIPGGQFSYEKGAGVLKSGMGYTLGAAPNHTEPQYKLDDLFDEELETLGNVVSSLTETYDKDSEMGKYLAAFQKLGDEEKTQSEIAEEVGIHQATLSNKKSEWEEYGLVEDRDYTKAGELVNDLIDELKFLKEETY